jgi:hypothetical protein
MSLTRSRNKTPTGLDAAIAALEAAKADLPALEADVRDTPKRRLANQNNAIVMLRRRVDIERGLALAREAVPGYDEVLAAAEREHLERASELAALRAKAATRMRGNRWSWLDEARLPHQLASAAAEDRLARARYRQLRALPARLLQDRERVFNHRPRRVQTEIPTDIVWELDPKKRRMQRVDQAAEFGMPKSDPRDPGTWGA